MPARQSPRSRRRRERVRRRRLALAGAAVASLLAGLAVGAGAGGDEERSPARRAAPGAAAERPPAGDAGGGLTLEQQVGQLVVLRFAGTTVPSYVRRNLRAGRAAGAILFRDNVTGPRQVRSLTRTLRDAAGRRPPLVCIDQEGGAIRILPWSPPATSQPEQGAAGSAGADALAAARGLRSQGVTVTLAPVADVPGVPRSAIAGREFAADPQAAATLVAAAVRGWRRGRVAPTLKHFPGLGAATVNTDDGPATIGGTRPELDDDLVPFRAGIAAGAPLVMVSSAVYTALDGDRIASQSPAVVGDLLRGELGFEGVAMTDSIEAAAVRAVTPDPGAAAVASVGAGIDVVLTTGRGSYIRVHRALLRKAREDVAFRARVRESAARVLALRERL